MSLAAVAAGADGLLIETHMNPEEAWSDGRQSVDPAMLQRIVQDVRGLESVRPRDLIDPR
jgi:3-deoxy-7-phosphoheptulonate synthase